MNLLHTVKGTTFWTADKLERVRVEQRIGNSEVFECSVFDLDGKHICTRRYHANGNPVHGNIYEKQLLAWNPTADEVEETKHGVAATAGHLASNGGLRGHSVGDVFPWIPFFKGPFYNQWVRSPDGLEHGPFDSVDEMKKFIDFYNYEPTFVPSSLYVYDYEQYDDAYEARDCGALYETPSSVDAIDIDHRTGIYDVQEVVQTIEKCLGRKVEAGIFDNNGVFYTLTDLINYSVKQEG